MGSKTLFKWPKQITNSLVVQLIKAEKDVHKAVNMFDSATAEYGNGFRHDHEPFCSISLNSSFASLIFPSLHSPLINVPYVYESG